MDSSLTLQLQQQRAWLHTQLFKPHNSSSALSSSSSSSSGSFFSSFPLPPDVQAPGPWPPRFLPSTDAWSPSPSADSPSWQSELAALSESWDDAAPLPSTSSSSTNSLSSSSSDASSLGASSSPYRGPSSASSDPWMPGNQFGHSAAALLDAPVAVETATFADDVLMDPVLEFISDILMDENMEGRKCMQQECLSYQARVNGFTGNALAIKSPSCGTNGQRFKVPATQLAAGGPEKLNRGLEEEDYSWIDQVLVPEPLPEGDIAGEESWTLDTSVLDNLELDSAQWTWPPLHEVPSCSGSDQDSKVFSFDSSSSSSPLSEDCAITGLLESSFGATHTKVSLPSANHTSSVPSFNSTLSFQNMLFKDVAPFRGIPSHGDLQPLLHGQSAVQSFKSSQVNSFFTVVEGSKALPAQEANGFVQEAKQVQTVDVSDERPLSFVKNEYLNAEKHAKMYGDWWPEQGDLVGKKKQAQHGKGKRKGKPESVDLRSLLVDCAQAVGANNLRKANEIVQELRQHTSPHGTASQRLAHYFTEGLLARLGGTGAQQYTAMTNNRPSAANMLKAFRLILEVCPFAKMAHFFANQNILKAAEAAGRIHIIDYGILYGVQWPALISALAERRGGPPFLRITGIEFPQPGLNPSERVEETGRRLAEYAKTYNVPFEYQAIANKWEDVELVDLNLREGEFIAVNCVNRLRHLMDETVVSASPRRKVLSRMHSLKPDIVVTVITNAGYNAPFFVSRFREALYHFSSQFDMIETTVADSENPLRFMLERECAGRDILNVVACEGHERVERPESYRQWQSRFQRAGFAPLTLDRIVLKKARDVVKAFYHKDFSVDDDSKWMLLGWKGRIMEGLSAWKCAAPAPVS